MGVTSPRMNGPPTVPGAHSAVGVLVRVHLVDGTYELFRAHYGRTPPRLAPDGRDVKATVGVVSSLLRLLADAEEQATHVAIAFDNPIRSFRNDLFPDYKDETGMDPDLLAQFDLVEEACRAIGVTVWSMDEYEADDAIGTAALALAGQVDQVRILTADKDLGQVVRGQKVVQVDTMRGREWDEAGVIERLGVPPTSVPDHLALVGDTADGIPGLPGFGAKSSATLLSHYLHLEAIPADPTLWEVRPRGADKLSATLEERREDALLYRQLATLVTDVPLDLAIDGLEWRGAPRDAFDAWADEMGVTTIRERVTRWA